MDEDEPEVLEIMPDERQRARALELFKAPRLPIQTDDYSWEEEAPGVRTSVLSDETARGLRRLLIWVSAGARVPRHLHFSDEDVLVLQGSLRINGEGEGIYGPGAVFRSRAGSEHDAEALPDQDCLCFVVVRYEPLID